MAQSMWVDYYAVLELYDPINQTGKGPDSTAKEIWRARNLQVSAWHPDKFKGDLSEIADTRTQLINEANEVLSNPDTKKAYDVEWLRRNAWFRREQDSKSAAPPEIAVRWDPPDALTNLFYGIPRGEKRTASLIIEPRVGRGFFVTIEEPASGWLRVVEPQDKRGTPPFTAVIEVDTTDLQPEHPYSDELIFVLEDG